MRLTTLQRFEFSAAHQLRGDGLESRLHGHNFEVWVGISGPVRADTGLILPRTGLRTAVAAALEQYDHRHLNSIFGDAEPTLLKLACALWADVRPALASPLGLGSLELREEDGPGVELTQAGAAAILTGGFSAAHRTHAPRLSDAENLALYGICNNPAGHGHNYRAEVYLPPEVSLPPHLWAEFDHKNLSADIPDLRGRNVVTEAIAELLSRRAPGAGRARVWETPAFFAEYHPAAARYRLGRRYRFNAAHRLHNPGWSAEENRRLYGKCSQPGPHGHSYLIEIAMRGALDPRTETAYDLGELDAAAGGILSELDYVDLDRVAAFRGQPSTGENLAAHLWSRFADRLSGGLDEVRIWETPDSQMRVTSDVR